MTAPAVEADERATFCECGCGEQTNARWLRVVDLRSEGVPYRQIAQEIGVGEEYAKSIFSKARRSEWPRFVVGHVSRAGSRLPRKKCEFPPCESLIPGFWHYCQDRRCQTARLSVRLGHEQSPTVAMAVVLARGQAIARETALEKDAHQYEVEAQRLERRVNRTVRSWRWSEEPRPDEWGSSLKAKRLRQKAVEKRRKSAQVSAAFWDRLRTQATMRAIRFEDWRSHREAQRRAVAERAAQREHERELRRRDRVALLAERRVKRAFARPTGFDNGEWSRLYDNRESPTAWDDPTFEEVACRFEIGSAEFLSYVKQAPIVPARFMCRVRAGELVLAVDADGPRFIRRREHARVDLLPWDGEPNPRSGFNAWDRVA